MLLKDRKSGLLVEVCNLSELTNPHCRCVHTRKLKGYRHASPEMLMKTDLMFVSGEKLPGCWAPEGGNTFPVPQSQESISNVLSA